MRPFDLTPLSVVVVLLLSGVLFWIAAIHNPGIPMRLERADSTADLLVTKAFWDGMNPYQDIYELAEYYDTDYVNPVPPGEAELIHPRTPGSLILMAPLALLDANGALYAMLAVGFAGVVGGMLLLSVSTRLSLFVMAAAIGYGLLSGPARWSNAFGTQSALLWGAIAVFVVALTRHWPFAAGVSLGIAGTLKVFPLLLLVFLLATRNWKSVWACIVTVGVLNGVALLSPQLDLVSAISAAISGGANWFDLSSNISLPAVIDRVLDLSAVGLVLTQVIIVVTGVWVCLQKRMALVVAVPFLLCVGLLASPLTWPHYILLLIPALMPVLTRIEGITAWSITLVAGLAATLPSSRLELHTLGLIFIAAALLLFSSSSKGQALEGRDSYPAVDGEPS